MAAKKRRAGPEKSKAKSGKSQEFAGKLVGVQRIEHTDPELILVEIEKARGIVERAHELITKVISGDDLSVEEEERLQRAFTRAKNLIFKLPGKSEVREPVEPRGWFAKYNGFARKYNKALGEVSLELIGLYNASAQANEHYAGQWEAIDPETLETQLPLEYFERSTSITIKNEMVKQHKDLAEAHSIVRQQSLESFEAIFYDGNMPANLRDSLARAQEQLDLDHLTAAEISTTHIPLIAARETEMAQMQIFAAFMSVMAGRRRNEASANLGSNDFEDAKLMADQALEMIQFRAGSAEGPGSLELWLSEGRHSPSHVILQPKI